MSGFLAYATADRVDIVADAAVYELDGTIIGFQEKITCSPHLPMAIVVRGNMVLGDTIARAIGLLSASGSFDGTLAAISAMLQANAVRMATGLKTRKLPFDLAEARRAASAKA